MSAGAYVSRSRIAYHGTRAEFIMPEAIPGLHHVTAIANNPQENVAFYTGVLGLRFVKRTVNFDDPATYHLYYGDEEGTPGTIMTFFPFENGRDGRVGRGQAGETAFVVPDGSLDYWTGRLESEGLDVAERETRFGETVLPFTDRDGQPLALVTGESDIAPYGDGPVPEAYAIRGFHGVTLDSLDSVATADVLETFDYERVGTEGDRIRFAAGDRAGVVDVLDRPDGERGVEGVGTVHHVAFRTADAEMEMDWRETLREAGYRVTEQKDRQYFQSIYFREPGGILFEIATDPPGFTRDESVEALGAALKLPPWLAEDREALESRLPPLDTPATTEMS